MNAAEYRSICARPDVMPRRSIRAAHVRVNDLRPDIGAELRRLLEADPIPKPHRHDSGNESDFFWLDLAPETIQDVVGVLGELEAYLVQSNTPGGGVGMTSGLLDQWNNARSSRASV